MFGSKKKKEQERDEEEKPFNWKKEVIEWVSLIFFTILFVTFLDTKVVVNSVVPSASMETTIMTGDHIFGNRLAYREKDPERFDIVIFRMPDDKSELYITVSYTHLDVYKRQIWRRGNKRAVSASSAFRRVS